MSDGFYSDSSSILFRKNGVSFSPNTLEGVVSVSADRNTGVSLGLINGASMSIQWGTYNYCSNNRIPMSGTSSYCKDAEVAVFTRDGSAHDFGGDTVLGWQSLEDVLGLITQYSSNNAFLEEQCQQ